MALHRGLGEEEFQRDLLVAQPGRHALQDVELTLRQARPPAKVEQHRVPLGRRQALDEFAGDDGVDHGAVRVDRPDGPDKVLGRDVLQHVPDGAGLDGLEDGFLIVVDGQHEHLRLRAGLFDLLGGVDPAAVRQFHVHQDDIGFELSGPPDGFLDAAGLADHGDIVLGLQDHPQSGGYDLVIVDQHDPDRHCDSRPSRGRFELSASRSRNQGECVARLYLYYAPFPAGLAHPHPLPASAPGRGRGAEARIRPRPGGAVFSGGLVIGWMIRPHR